MNIWQQLKQNSIENNRPFTVLAPMEDVTDTVFRQVIGNCAPPDLYFTEFMSVAGFNSDGRKDVSKRLMYTDSERPIIAQIWGTEPKDFEVATKEIMKLGFDGIDINMGCPVRKIVKTGGCSALIKTPTLAGEIIDAVISVAGEMPVSVKTRIGFSKVITEEWLGLLLGYDLAAITVHGRISKEMSTKPCDWDEIGKAVALRDDMGKDTLIVGNGDIMTMFQAQEVYEKYKVDGVMIGRGVFNNPYVFDWGGKSDIQPAELLNIFKNHVELWLKTYGEGDRSRHFSSLKKFVKMYVKGFDGAAELRDGLYRCESAEELLRVVGDTGLEPMTSTVSL
jgi:tRNA-dihydrouridine synthase